MAVIHQQATQILANLKMTSDNVELSDCYFLCANKDHIEKLKEKDHQVIWGRRGTGKTTLLKAFTYSTNFVIRNPENVAIYIVMAKAIPTTEEIGALTGDGSSLAVYIFSKLIGHINSELEKLYSARSQKITRDANDKFEDAYFKLEEYLKNYQMCAKGGAYSVDNRNSNEASLESGNEIGVNIKAKDSFVEGLLNWFRKKRKTNNTKQSFAVTGQIQFILETETVSELMNQMLDALGISCAYICLDEYSEMDKVSKYSIQSKVAQLIKQVFFKSSRYSVKIATIWSSSKLHTRGSNRIEGIEYQQDIFAGPNLDIMFMSQNADVIGYFKELLVNAYTLGENYNDEEKRAISDYIEKYIFTEVGLRHIICGSQGVSRAFVILAKAYLERLIKEESASVKLSVVYEMIKTQYLENVRNKIPYYALYRTVDKYVSENLCRYFLVKRTDYERCKSLINYLASRGVFMQMPGHLTDRGIRDDYKLFVVHYGNYLDALGNDSYRKGRRVLGEDAELKEDGMLLPNYSNELIEHPEKYTVIIPENAENERFCTECRAIVNNAPVEGRYVCPTCKNEMIRFIDFVDEVSI